MYLLGSSAPTAHVSLKIQPKHAALLAHDGNILPMTRERASVGTLLSRGSATQQLVRFVVILGDGVTPNVQQLGRTPYALPAV